MHTSRDVIMTHSEAKRSDTVVAAASPHINCVPPILQLAHRNGERAPSEADGGVTG